MKTRVWLNLIIVLTIASVGCSNGPGGRSGVNSDGNSIFSEIAQFWLTCDSLDGGPAACNNTQHGKTVFLAWTSELCSAINWQNIVGVEATTLFCAGGACTAEDSVKWKSPTTGAPIYNISSQARTAFAWLNLVNNGAADLNGPQSGDVVCCHTVATQNADTLAYVQSADCKPVQ